MCCIDAIYVRQKRVYATGWVQRDSSVVECSQPLEKNSSPGRSWGVIRRRVHNTPTHSPPSPVLPTSLPNITRQHTQVQHNCQSPSWRRCCCSFFGIKFLFAFISRSNLLPTHEFVVDPAFDCSAGAVTAAKPSRTRLSHKRASVFTLDFWTQDTPPPTTSPSSFDATTTA